MGLEICNARITSATITIEDHGILSVWLTLDYGGSGQGFGGFVLGKDPKREEMPIEDQGGWCSHFIWRCMQVAGVESWNKMVGQNIRAKREHSKIHAIGHILNDDWFDPAKDFEKQP